jgi:transcription-repair coupling factor (superfamily II helicase)
MQRVCPHSYLHGHALVMKKASVCPVTLRAQLDSAGYRHVDQVMEHGEYATRGALLDLFPMGSAQPYRLDFFDDEIDSLRLFDADSQRTLEEVEPSIYCLLMNSRRIKPPSNCFAASGAISSTSSAMPNISINR